MTRKSKNEKSRKVIRILFPPVYPITTDYTCRPVPCLRPTRKFMYPGFFAEVSFYYRSDLMLEEFS